jgi:hypothetical protein
MSVLGRVAEQDTGCVTLRRARASGSGWMFAAGSLKHVRRTAG